MDARAWMLRRKGSAVAGAAVPVDWEAVYAEQLPRVYNYFRFRTGNAWLAEDLTAQTFERAWRARATYRPERGDTGPWLLAIARNVAHSHHRRGPSPERSLEGADRPSP
jgi:RNA polymerase sigma-70 factor (ECF subfamily)